jgi:hypothetical protein
MWASAIGVGSKNRGGFPSGLELTSYITDPSDEWALILSGNIKNKPLTFPLSTDDPSSLHQGFQSGLNL